jgi:porphobilinogen synthase
MVRETHLGLGGIIEPFFVCPGKGVRRPIDSMPGCAQLSIDVLVEECQRSHDLGIPATILFGIPEKKDAVGSEAYAENGIVPRAIAL